MPEAPLAELTYKDRLKLELFPTIWCPGCGIGTIMMMLAMVLDEMRLDERNTVIVTGIGCTGRMGGYLKHEAVYTLHGRTLPVAEAIKTVRPEMNVIVVAGDGDTASIGGNHLIHSIRRNAPVTSFAPSGVHAIDCTASRCALLRERRVSPDGLTSNRKTSLRHPAASFVPSGESERAITGR